MSSKDPRGNQPLTSGPGRNNSEYVEATWKPLGAGGGAPKISGGYEQSKTSGTHTGRGLNRPDQRYAQSEAVLQARRDTRAAMEYASCVILAGARGLVEIRSSTGRNYDIDTVGVQCDCPDMERLAASGKAGVICKHLVMANMAITAAGDFSRMNWSTSRLAEVCGCSERTARELCAKGTIPAGKVNDIWVIAPVRTMFLAVRAYTGKQISRKYMPQPSEATFQP